MHLGSSASHRFRTAGRAAVVALVVPVDLPQRRRQLRRVDEVVHLGRRSLVADSGRGLSSSGMEDRKEQRGAWRSKSEQFGGKNRKRAPEKFALQITFRRAFWVDSKVLWSLLKGSKGSVPPTAHPLRSKNVSISVCG